MMDYNFLGYSFYKHVIGLPLLNRDWLVQTGLVQTFMFIIIGNVSIYPPLSYLLRSLPLKSLILNCFVNLK